MGESIDLRAWHTGAEPPALEEHSGRQVRCEPAMDVSETSGQFLLEVELPGVAKEDIELTINGRRLELKGVRAPLAVEGSVLVAERHSGPFELEVMLPREFSEGPQADYREGVLTIRFPQTGSVQEAGTGRPPRAAGQGQWPPIDVLDTGHGLMLLADLPGVPLAAIEVLFEEQKLTLQGRRELEAAGRRYLQAGRHAGSFSRSVLLPDWVEGDRIKASYKEGVLSVEVPASGATARPRKLDLSSMRTSSSEQAVAGQQLQNAREILQHLRGELEELRAQHQSLRNEMDGFWLALGCGLRLAQMPLHQHLPVELSLRDEEPAVRQQVMAAVMGFVEFAGFELWREHPPESGSFLKRWQVRTRRKESQLEFQQRLLRMQEALELVRRSAMQAREPRPEDFQDAERQKLLGEAARAWAEAIFTLAKALRAATVGASVLIGALSLQKQEAAREGVAVVLHTLDEEELASRLRNWPAAPPRREAPEPADGESGTSRPLDDGEQP